MLYLSLSLSLLALPAALPAAGIPATGMVVDEDGAAVAGAEVRLLIPLPPGDLVAAGKSRPIDDAERVRTCFTGAEGRFELADLAAGRYTLEVWAAGYAPAEVSGLWVGDGEARADFGTVVLVPGASIEVRVTDADGAAVAGAAVAVDTGRRGLLAMIPASARQDPAETDAEGRFVAADLTPGQPVTLFVSKQGYGSETVSGLRPPVGEPVAVVLRPSGRLKGRVVDALGAPIEGAFVEALRGGTRSRRGRIRARTDADGRFLIEDVEAGTLRVSAGAEAYLRQVRPGIEVAAGEDREVSFALETGAVVAGTLLTAAGEPVAQASIGLVPWREGGRADARGGRTDADGRYRIAGVPPGPASITVDAGGRRRLERNVDVRPGTHRVDLVLERDFEVRGRVVAPDGTPVGGATVSIRETEKRWSRYSFFDSAEAASGDDGTFTFTGISAGSYVVGASREGFSPASAEAFEVAGDVAGLLVELGSGATLKGRVLGLEADELGSLELLASGPGTVLHLGRLDSSGGYSFDGLAPGGWAVRAQLAGSRRTFTVQIEIPEGASEVERDIDFGLGHTLSGLVLDGGRPLAGATVTASSVGDSFQGEGSTGTDGRFRIEGLEAGGYQVAVRSGMGRQHSEVLELAGDRDLRIEISTGSISGTVRDPGGEPLAGAFVALEPLDAADDTRPLRRVAFGRFAQSDPSGRFQVPQVLAGSWRLIATKPGFGPAEAEVAVAGGAAPEVEVLMSPTEGVAFEVVPQSGAVVPSVRVAILDPSGRRLALDSHPVVDGKVRVSTVPPGRWDLVIQGGDSAAVRVSVQSPGDQGRFVLPTGGELHIRVPELEREPVAGVVLRGPDGRPFVSASAFALAPGEWFMAGGRARVRGLVPGDWSFTVKHRDGRTWSGTATVTAGATTEVSLP